MEFYNRYNCKLHTGYRGYCECSLFCSKVSDNWQQQLEPVTTCSKRIYEFYLFSLSVDSNNLHSKGLLYWCGMYVYIYEHKCEPFSRKIAYFILFNSEALHNYVFNKFKVKEHKATPIRWKCTQLYWEFEWANVPFWNKESEKGKKSKNKNDDAFWNCI